MQVLILLRVNVTISQEVANATLDCLKWRHPDRENTERGTIIGLRNAHDKCFPAGLCAGDAPFVCDNLIFTNSVKLARRHTRHILAELDQVIARTLGKLFSFWGGQDQRIESYKDFDLTNPQVNDLVIRAYKAGAISKTKVVDVVQPMGKVWPSRILG